MHEELQTLIALHRPQSTEFWHGHFGMVRADRLLKGDKTQWNVFENLSTSEQMHVASLAVIEMQARYAAIQTMYDDSFKNSEEYRLWRQKKRLMCKLTDGLQRYYRLEILKPLLDTLFDSRTDYI